MNTSFCCNCTACRDHTWYNGVGGTAELRDVWEEGAFHLERLQAAEECVNAEQAVQASRQAPTWILPFTPTWTPEAKLKVGLSDLFAQSMYCLVHHCADARQWLRV